LNRTSGELDGAIVAPFCEGLARLRWQKTTKQNHEGFLDLQWT
jgi:hypothetical protein